MFFPIDVIGKDSAFNRDQYTDAYAPGIERLFWHVARILGSDISEPRAL